MKVFVNNKVYVQNNDLAYFLKGVEGKSVPSSIFNKIFGDVFIVDGSNRNDFVEFTSPEEVEFFRNCDWIIDYDSFNAMSEEEIIEYATHINDERNRIAEEFNSLSVEERKDKYISTAIKLEVLDFQFESVRDFLWYKQGHIKIKLPIEIKTNDAEKVQKSESKLKRVLRNIIKF